MGLVFGHNGLVAVSVKSKLYYYRIFKPSCVTYRGLCRRPAGPENAILPDHDFILSILRSNPSRRDSRSYLNQFGNSSSKNSKNGSLQPNSKPNPVVASILNPVIRRTALVKLQGPFSDRQLDSIIRGLVYLEKLGLASIVVVENVHISRGEQDERTVLIEDVMRVVTKLEQHATCARPFLGPVVRLGPKPGQFVHNAIPPPESHVLPLDLIPIRSALRACEIPVITPFALDSFSRSVRIDANDVIAGLVQGMAEKPTDSPQDEADERTELAMSRQQDIDLTPLRLMIVNREGGIPSYARSGYPHLLINLASEYAYIHDTFDPSWHHAHHTALSNLALARTCLSFMPPVASAIMVSHKSPSSLIGNLITNKPVLSSSLPHALLQGNRKLTVDTPTLIRRGSPIRVFQSLSELDKTRLSSLLEQSFNKCLDEQHFFQRLEETLDFAIVAGDYAGIAIVTKERCPGTDLPITYLDKFAVLPAHQGDGTVDFLWVALHDESYGLGHPFSANPNGGKGGIGEARDLVWRSRTDNPVNKWYFERSSGHFRIGPWTLFWCDAEKRLRKRSSSRPSYIQPWEEGRLAQWADVVLKIPSSWKQ